MYPERGKRATKNPPSDVLSGFYDGRNVVPRDGLEPSRLAAGDFESPVSTDFTTWADGRGKGRIIHELPGFGQVAV